MASATVGALRVTLGLDSAAFTEGLSRAQRHLRQTGDRLKSVGQTMATVGAGMTAAITAPLVAVGVKAVQAAADAEELQSAFNYSFGSMADEMNEWARVTGDALGRSTQAMQQAGFTFNQLFSAAAPTGEVAAELSQRFAVLAQDLSSFYNVAEGDALDKLRAGLVGEAEPLRAFGVFLTAAAVEAKALEMGLADANGEISEQAKILARAELIYEATADAQGDLARTQGSFTNQMRRLQAAWDELLVTIGQKVMPLFAPVVRVFADLATKMANMSPQALAVSLAVAGIAAALGPLIIAAGAVVAAMGALLPIIGSIGAPLLAAGAAVAALVAAFMLFRDDIMPVVQAFAASVQENLGPKIAPLWEALKGAVQAIGEVFSAIFGERNGEATVALVVFGEVVSRSFAVIVDLITGAINTVTNILRALAALLRGDFSAMWGHLGEAVMSLVRGILSAFETLFPGVIGWVQRTFEGIKHWLLDRFTAVVRGIGEKVDQVEGFFRNLWDAVVGNSWIPDMVIAIGEWMGPRLQDAMVDPAKDATAETSEAFSGMAQDASSEMDRLFRSIANKDWKGALSGLLDIFSQQGGILGSIGKIGSAIMGALPGFKTGGSFRVGGAGGSDSQMVAFRATPGEMVDIRRPGQELGGGALSVHVSPSPYFDVRVEEVAAPIAAQAAIGAYGVTRAESQRAGRRARQSFIR